MALLTSTSSTFHGMSSQRSLLRKMHMFVVLLLLLLPACLVHGGCSSVAPGTQLHSFTDAFDDPYWVAVDGSGNIYVVDAGNLRVVVLSSNGTQLHSFTDSFGNPSGVVVDGSGNIYVGDFGNNRVMVLSSNGTQLRSFSDGFSSPAGVAVDGSGNIYVADGGNDRVVVLSSNGTQLHSFTDGFNAPYGVAVDSSSNIYVTDQHHNRVVVLSSNGTQLHSFTDDFDDPSGVAVDGSGNIYVADYSNNRVVVLSPYGTQLHSFTDGFYYPFGVAVDGTGNIFVADTYNNRVVVLAGIITCASSSSSSMFSSPISSSASSFIVPQALPISFTSPYGIVFDGLGHLYVSDSSANTVTKMTTAGAHVSTINFDFPALNSPRGLSLDSTGNLYLADQFNDRIVKFSAGGAQLAVLTSTSPALNWPYGVFVDLFDNVWLVNTFNDSIVQVFTNGTQGLVVITPSSPVLGYPCNIAVDSAISIFISDTHNNRVLKRYSNGTLVTLYSALSNPQDVKLDWLGNLFIADTQNNRVVQVSSTGNLLQVLTTSSPALNGPTSVALDSAGNLYVCDYYNGRVVRFAAATLPMPSSSSSSSASNGGSSSISPSPPSSGSAPGILITANISVSSLNSAPFSGRWMARGIQQSLYSNPYLPAIYLIGGQGTAALTGAVWESLDGGVTWSALGSNLTLSAIPTFMGAAVALLVNGVLVIYGGQLLNGSATSYVATTSTLFSTVPLVYTAPFTPRYDHAYTTIPGTNMTLFCGGLTSTNATTNNCWMANRPELGASAWTQQTPSGPFPSSLSNAALVTLYDVNSTLLLCGGAVVSNNVSTAINTCWVSQTLGVTWSAAIPAPWGARTGLVMTSDLNDWAYLYGGQSTSTSLYFYDLWLSTDHAVTWTPVSFHGGSFIDIQWGCVALYYTQQYINGIYVTSPQLVLYSGYQPSIGGYVMGDYFAPISVGGGGLVSVTPPLSPFSISYPLVVSECQFTFNIAGTLTGFGVSSANPNAALEASFIAALVGAILGIPASAVQVCVHVTYAGVSTQRGEVYLYSASTLNVVSVVNSIIVSTNTALLSTPTILVLPSAIVSGSLCLLSYSLPGNVDYPWSVATSLAFYYNTSFVLTKQGAAVQLINGTGSRTYINRFGASFTTTLSLASSGSVSLNNNHLLYLGSALPVDGNGLTWNLSFPVQLPGAGPAVLYSLINVVNASGAVVEAGASVVDGLGQAFLSSVPGFVNVTIGASNVNSLAANYVSCQAPITFTNGLRQPTQPSASNGALRISYSYFISDGATYSVQGNLTITTASAFATTKDMLGNPYQTVVNVTGSRTYTYLPTQTRLTSIIHGLSQSVSVLATQRFYPYPLLSSAPGVYTMNTAPFFDADGLEFAVAPSIPANGSPSGTGTQYTASTLSIITTPNMVAVLTEGVYNNAPLLNLQTQSYTLL